VHLNPFNRPYRLSVMAEKLAPLPLQSITEGFGYKTESYGYITESFGYKTEGYGYTLHHRK